MKRAPLFVLAAAAFAAAVPGRPAAAQLKTLAERPGIIPAPYLARAHWVALEIEDALGAKELKQRLRDSYDLVFAKLPKKTREGLAPT